MQVKLEGFAGEPTRVTATIIDAQTGQQTDPVDVGGFEAEAKSDQARADLTVPIAAPGRWVVRFVLYDPDGVELDRAQTGQLAIP